MRHWQLGALLLTAGCNSAGYEAVSIRPTYGWEDGCTSVKISGHGFSDDVSATVGGNAVTDITPAEAEEDRQFFFFGVVPAADETGPVDVSVTSGGKVSTIDTAFYYIPCPGPGYIDAFSPEEDVAGNSVISIAGCGLDAGSMQVRIIDPTGVVPDATADLVSDCGTAYVSFNAPALADGTYWLFIEETATGDILNPSTGDPRTCLLDTAADCEAAFTITYGGAT